MSATDPEQSRPTQWTFKEWLNGVTQGFFGPKRGLVDGGGIRKDLGSSPATKAAALLARKRATDKYVGPGYISRMEEAKLKNMMWENMLRPLVEDRLRTMFHPDNYARMKLDPSLWQNQMRRIVGELSKLYQKPPHRSLEEEDEKAEKKTQTEGNNPAADKQGAPPAKEDPTAPGDAPTGKLPQVQGAGDVPPPTAEGGPQTGNPDVDSLADVLDLEGADHAQDKSPLDIVMELEDLDVVMDLVEKMVRFQDCVWVRPIVTYEQDVVNDDPEAEKKGDIKTGKLSYVIYDPSCADIIEDPENPEKALCFYYWGAELQDNGSLATRIHFFTNDEYVKFDGEWKELAVEVNELQRLPVAKFVKEKPSLRCYFVNGAGRDLYEGTLEMCILRTISKTRFRDSGFKQVAITGDEDSTIADQVMGGPSPLFVPEGGSVAVLDLAPMLKDMQEHADSVSLEQAAQHGISQAEYKQEGAPQSGFAKKLDQTKMLEENKRIRKFFVKGEQDLYNLLAKVLKLSPIEGVPDLPEDGKLCIDFAEPEFTEDPATQIKTDAAEIKLNLVSLIEILKRRNPDLTETELVEQLHKNKRINDAFIGPAESSLWEMMAMKDGSAAGKAAGGAPGANPPGGGPKPPTVPGAPTGGPPKPPGNFPPFGGKK